MSSSPASIARKGRQSGSSLVEICLVGTVLIFLILGVMEFGIIGSIANSISYSASRAARYAAVRGSSSGHPATVANIQNVATGSMLAFNPSGVTVTVNWTPDNKPGSTVQVQVSYAYKPLLVPISAAQFTLASTAQQIIIQ